MVYLLDIVKFLAFLRTIGYYSSLVSIIILTGSVFPAGKVQRSVDRESINWLSVSINTSLIFSQSIGMNLMNESIIVIVSLNG